MRANYTKLRKKRTSKKVSLFSELPRHDITVRVPSMPLFKTIVMCIRNKKLVLLEVCVHGLFVISQVNLYSLSLSDWYRGSGGPASAEVWVGSKEDGWAK